MMCSPSVQNFSNIASSTWDISSCGGVKCHLKYVNFHCWKQSCRSQLVGRFSYLKIIIFPNYAQCTELWQRAAGLRPSSPLCHFRDGETTTRGEHSAHGTIRSPDPNSWREECPNMLPVVSVSGHRFWGGWPANWSAVLLVWTPHCSAYRRLCNAFSLYLELQFTVFSQIPPQH